MKHQVKKGKQFYRCWYVNKRYQEGTSRRRTIKSRYGITLEQYDELLAIQGGVCAGCKKKPGGHVLCVDHDHACCPRVKTCGRCIRGLLCDKCNTGLGKFKDRIDALENIIDYLKNPPIRALLAVA